jgi:hypothetical protein
MAWIDDLAKMLRLNDGQQAYTGYPQMQVGLNKPRQAGYATGFLEGATGADSMQPKNPITDPNYDAYAQGKNTGEIAGIGAMALSPLALTRKQILSKEMQKFPELPEGVIFEKLHPTVQTKIKQGMIDPSDAQMMSDYAYSPGSSLVETGTGAYKDQSEKMQNYLLRIKNKEVSNPWPEE